MCYKVKITSIYFLEQDIIGRQHHDVTRRVTTVDNTDSELNEILILSAEQFRSKLITSIMKHYYH